MPSSTRRSFLKTGAAFASTASALTAKSRPLMAQFANEPEQIPPIQDPVIKQLCHLGIDVARAAGAVYADVRLTHRKMRRYGAWKPVQGGEWFSSDEESMTIGFRALVDGYWGFASGPVWNRDEAARLGRMAVHIARTNALGKTRQVTLAPTPVIRDQHWVMPVKINPFDVSRSEVVDHLGALYRFTQRFPGFGAPDLAGVVFEMTNKAFGSSDGSYITQRIFQTAPDALFTYTVGRSTLSGGIEELLSISGKGWEIYTEQPLREHLRRLYEELKEDAALPPKPVDIGKYEAVFDAYGVARLVGSSIGVATQLDRIMGYEANAGGTSYINDPQEMLGQFKIGSPLLTVTANRSALGGAATVKWDDEGVEPDAFTLVDHGILTDFQTGRESAGWVQEWKTPLEKPFRSHGCVSAPEAVDAPLIHNANLTVTPENSTLDLSTLVSNIKKGVFVKRGECSMDFQKLNGYGMGTMYEVKDGKRTARLIGAGTLFRAPEFWSSIQAIGGTASKNCYGLIAAKGEPGQRRGYSVNAIPIAVKELTVIDRLRKA